MDIGDIDDIMWENMSRFNRITKVFELLWTCDGDNLKYIYDVLVHVLYVRD